MKTKKWIALALTLLMLLSLAPAALAAESVLGDVLADLGPGLSLRSMIDPDKSQIELAGSSFQLENLVFFDEAVVNEDMEICLVETTENGRILDENTLPEGLKYEVRREKVRVPDGRDGVWVADEIRRERAGQPAPDEPELDEADKDRETYYLYLTGKPKRAGEYLFVLWDGTIKLCSVTVLTERPEPTEQPEGGQPSDIMEQTWGGPVNDPGTVTEEWVDPVQQDTTPTNPPAPAFILPDPSVSVTGSTNVAQGESTVLEAKVSNDYNPSYQWFLWDDARKDWQTLSGETGSSYRPDTSTAGAWAYLCQVTNSSSDGQTATAYSDPVIIQVEAAPAVPVPNVGNITGSTKVEQGQNAVLEVHATDTYNASYQWYENNTPISGANASQYRPDTSSAGTQTYVCEVTNTYNGQSATAYSNPVTFTVEAKPTLPTPTVSIKGNTSVRTGERAVLEAEVSNAFNVSFQWYVGYGNYWAKIDDETGRSIRYSPDTNRAGTWTYYCEITSSGYGDSITVKSDPVTFTVADRVVVTPTPTPTPNKTVYKIEVAKLPNKIDYNDGEAVDATGLQLRVLYTDGTNDTITDGFMVRTRTVNYNNTGLADVNVNYRGYQTSYQVKVHSVAEQIREIRVLTMPNKSSYTVGEYLNTAGLTIRVYSTDGRYLDVGEGFTCSPTYFSNPGNQTVTVSFMGKTCTFTVAVQQARRVTGLSIQSLPANRSYTVGDTISTAGLVLQLQTTGGYETVTSGYTISPRVATTAGSQQITVNYEGMSTTYTIDVRSNIPYATPTPAPTPYYGSTTPSATMPTPLPVGTTPAPYGVSPSPAPFGTVSPSPTGFPMPSASVAPTPVHTPAPARRNTGVSTAVKVLFVVAVVALGGLIGYVLYLRKTGGDEEDFVDEPRTSEKLKNLFNKKDKK